MLPLFTPAEEEGHERTVLAQKRSRRVVYINQISGAGWKKEDLEGGESARVKVEK